MRNSYTQTKSELWEHEHFEESVNRAIICQHEPQHKRSKSVVPGLKVDFGQALHTLRNIGCYFAPSDREIIADEIDVINDGFPQVGSLATVTNIQDKKKYLNGYLHVMVCQLATKLPPFWNTDKQPFAIYDVYNYVAMNDGLIAAKTACAFDENGNTIRTYFKRKIETQYGTQTVNDYGQTENIEWSAKGLIPLSFYADRRFVWNVEATDGIAKVIFGIYPEEVKSLFYAREVPLSTTGRKRPILHWVAAHRRRIKNGDDINLDKYLRGCNEFVMNGTKFTIVNPLKKD